MSKPKNICINLNFANQSNNGKTDKLLPIGEDYLRELILERVYEVTQNESATSIEEYKKLGRKRAEF